MTPAVLFIIQFELPYLLALEIQDAAVDGPDQGVIIALERKSRYPGIAAGDIDAYRGNRRGGFVRLVRIAFLFRRARRFARLQVVFVAEQGRRVNGQGQGVNARGFVVKVVEFETGKGQVEIAVGEEINIFPIAGKNRREIVVNGIGQLESFFLLQRIHPDGILGAVAVLAVHQPARIGRPVVIGDVVAPGFVHHGDLAAGDLQDLQQLVLVGEQQHAAVRRPLGRETPDAAVEGQLHRLAGTVGVFQENLILAGEVRVVRDRPAVGRPGRKNFTDPLAAGQIVDQSFFFRDRENIAPGLENRPLAARRYVITGNEVADIFKIGQDIAVVEIQVDGQALLTPRVQVEPVQITAVLVYQPAVAPRRPQDVIITMAGDLFDAVGFQVKGIDIQGQVAIGNEILFYRHTRSDADRCRGNRSAAARLLFCKS